MTKPAAARTKTDAQLAAEEEREAKAAEKRRLDPNAPFVSVSSARLAAVVPCTFALQDGEQQLQEHCHQEMLLGAACWLVAALCLPA